MVNYAPERSMQELLAAVEKHFHPLSVEVDPGSFVDVPTLLVRMTFADGRRKGFLLTHAQLYRVDLDLYVQRLAEHFAP